jgi:uncharacterized protein YneF (UPF0154 family)
MFEILFLVIGFALGNLFATNKSLKQKLDEIGK